MPNDEQTNKKKPGEREREREGIHIRKKEEESRCIKKKNEVRIIKEIEIKNLIFVVDHF